MDSNNSYVPPVLFPDYSSSMNQKTEPPGNSDEKKTSDSPTRTANNSVTPGTTQSTSDSKSPADENKRRDQVPLPLPLDLAETVGMYRLLDLISETGSNGCVDKVIIAQDSLKRFINAMSPGTYASITKVDFKTLDRLMIKPLGVYGCKTEIVNLLRSINMVNEDVARLLLAPTEFGGPKPTLSSGLYIVPGGSMSSAEERHYVIYWPEDSTWDDSAASSVSRNRVTYLTKICDQVVALLSSKHSASIVWNEEDDGGYDTESEDLDVGDSNRLVTFVVEKTNDQEEGAESRPGFQMKSHHISRPEVPVEPSPDLDPSMFFPRLLHGETTQAFWTVTYIPRQSRWEEFNRRVLTWASLHQLLNENYLVLSEALDEKAVQILMDVALLKKLPEQCSMWRKVQTDIREKSREELSRRQGVACQDLDREEHALRVALREAVVTDVVKLFPTIKPESLSSHVTVNGDKSTNQAIADCTQLDTLRHLYPDFENIYQRHLRNAKFETIKGSDYRSLKERLIFLRHMLGKHQNMDPGQRRELIQALISERDLSHAQHVLPKAEKDKNSGMISSFLKTVKVIGSLVSGSKEPDEDSLKKEMKRMAKAVSDPDFLRELKGVVDEDLESPIREVIALAHTQLSSHIDAEVIKMTHAELQMRQDYCKKCIKQEIEAEERSQLSDALVAFIRELNGCSVTSVGRKHSVVTINSLEEGSRFHREYKIIGGIEAPEEHKLEFRVHIVDLTSDDKDSMQIKSKHIPNPIMSYRRSAVFHLPIGPRIVLSRLLENERLLLVLTDRDKYLIYLERIFYFSFDEEKRMLAVCTSATLQLYEYVFDETFRTLQAQGSPISLARWYGQADVSISHMSPVCGDEVVLIDSTMQARIFSFVTMQFRPASLRLQSMPSAVYSAPDGSCLLVLHGQAPQASLTVYHWETFGSTDGILLDVPEFSLEGAVLTSMVNRGYIFLLGLDIDEHCMKSIAIDITRRATEFVFKEKGNTSASDNNSRQTLHNSVIDCHRDVWTRFPVYAAVRRRTITSSSERQQKTLTFITERPTQPFAPYFSELIRTFERETKKPTGDELRRIDVSTATFETFRDKVWLVDLLCLIPIHIAICRENRFIPLANGVFSADLERSLLGAEVNRIVDKLSFGWYESIFQSYMALKPVKVVSSMGQQSVGKSFALNHLVDTSFAGSAMRTTEGVWMSVTPTNEELIVALDFEGVDSIERSPQEDALLVLFNTAISNLVLFRNNFAFSRDISGLFQSFQSSASVLDPAANPTLFQSTLVIIIKDVVESDKKEITREFSLKFQKIVQQEKDANFISRLHSGKLDIIPWPVIESKEFYKLFATLKRRLDLQKISHPTAGEFLHTIKTLMAKIKDFDTDLIVECDDTKARFAISEHEQTSPASVEEHLTALMEISNPNKPRQSIPDSEWMFKGNHASMGDLRRNFDSLVIQMKTDVQFCGAQCVSCHLLCVRGRLHEGGHSCKTDHMCSHRCGFCEGDSKACGTPAGHPGKHICVVNAHLCGEPCRLSGKRGCLEDCTKVLGHTEDEHMCSTLVHMCGEPCALQGMRQQDGKMYSCPERCSVPSEQDHESHSCDTRLCPRTCELCQRLCGQPHLHGLTPGTHHLCGEAHPCSALCSAQGTCQINTAPHSVEATFTGRHETFQYTKSVAKRLPCVEIIPAGHLSHKGSHTHSTEKRPFHFCETRCDNCGYFCTLPLGHTQQEHETSHGSMTQTRWAVDGPDEASLELGGRRFSSNDDGAPMMCNLVCSSMGRHVHIDYCRAVPGIPCDGPDVQHNPKRMIPNPDKPKDCITHSLYWRRMDPYTRDEQENFAKWYHSGTTAGTGQPSYCTLPMFHPSRNLNDLVNGLGYVSNDGHLFGCNNPVVMQQAFHVMFVIDRSGSMSSSDRQPLNNAPQTNRIRQRCNNRLGAVYSALYSFWSARHAATTTATRQTVGARRDYTRPCNDFSSSPDDLLNAVLNSWAGGGTNFSQALREGQAVMEQHWSTERTPVMIFLSDGECSVPDSAIQDVCRCAIRLGKSLSFHSVSFGPDSSSSSLRRMANLALEIQNNAPRDPQGLRSAAASIPSSFAIALDTVQLAETFLGIAESMRKPRGSLMR
ncbi:hypothetical protein BGW80DRAFT_1345251 [Lactifluus volemus]|nr:hypothetical protein BGW80DRAFT_1345251 [Lactifluus volemus]